MAASRAASGFVRALSKRRSTPGASFSTQASKPASPVPMAVAGVAVLSAGFVGAFRFVTGPMSVDTGDHPQVVSSQEELNELRSKLFNEGESMCQKYFQTFANCRDAAAPHVYARSIHHVGCIAYTCRSARCMYRRVGVGRVWRGDYLRSPEPRAQDARQQQLNQSRPPAHVVLDHKRGSLWLLHAWRNETVKRHPQVYPVGLRTLALQGGGQRL
mmetsp:Transcript_12850/g.20388  ORF Transcript_12850/g.20388 Transcript_12850/m.20388 type:complete len:215 (+) Transcript_12850:70-714(+)